MASNKQQSLLEQLPDLSALESVEVRMPRQPVFATFALLLVGSVVFMSAWAYFKWSEYLPDTQPLLLGGCGIGLAVWIWVACRMLISDFHWRTDESGFFTRSLLRRTFTRWQDLSSPPRSIRAYRPTITTLEASMWQHMRRHGKADTVTLSEYALSLWDAIPDELPREMEWNNPRPAGRALKISEPVKYGLGLVGFLLIGLGKILGSEDIGTWGGLSLYAAFFASWISWQNRRFADHISLQGRRLEAQTARCTLILEPGDVTRAGWRPDGLHLTLRDKSTVVVPIDTVFDESSKLALAIIRWLRDAPRPVPVWIPAVLRSHPYDDLGPEDTERDEGGVEVRHGLADKIALSLLAAFTGPVCVLALEGHPVLHIVLGVALTGAGSAGLCWWLLGSYRITADRKGITKRFLWWRERAKWTDVTNYTIGNLAGQGAYYQEMRRLLRDADGRVLTRIPAQIGPKLQWARFLRFVHARLAETLPPDGFNKTWKSRPFAVGDTSGIDDV